MSEPTPARAPGDQTVETLVDLAVITPDDWWAIPLLDHQVRSARIEALVARQFRGSDNQPLIKAELHRDLEHQAAVAAEAGGRLMVLSTMQVGSIPVTAALTTYLTDLGAPDTASHVRDLHARLLEKTASADAAASPGSSPQYDRADLAAGETLRRVRFTRGPAAPTRLPDGVEVMLVDYWVEMPGHRGLGQLSFSTAMTVWSEQMLTLFDAIASSAHWVSLPSGGARASEA